MRVVGRGTTRNRRVAPAEDLVKELLRLQADKVWVAEHHVRCHERTLYLFILDAHSRSLVGRWKSHLRTEIVWTLWTAMRRKPALACGAPRTRGVQYTSSFGERLKEVGIKPSMGKDRDRSDNAMRELRFDAEGELTNNNRVPEQAGRQDSHLRLPGNLLQHPQAALISGLQKSR